MLGSVGPIGGRLGALGSAGPIGGRLGVLGSVGPMGGRLGALGSVGPMGGRLGVLGSVGPIGGRLGALGAGNGGQWGLDVWEEGGKKPKTGSYPGRKKCWKWVKRLQCGVWGGGGTESRGLVVKKH